MGGAAMGPSEASVMMYTLKDSYSLWDVLNDSPIWQDRIFHVLAALYGIVAVVAMVQLIRIQQRVPEYGWTTQKVFHFLNFLIARHMLLDLPSLAFFTTYVLLVLFWAEIYYQARTVSTDGLRPAFFIINGVVALWLIIWWKPIQILVIVSKVGYVTAICFACFLARCIMMCFNAFNEAANLDVLEHPVLNFIYYLLVEILPSALVLFILRKLPPKRGIIQYHAIR
ncbi:protein of unknown function DUF1084 [Cynara cardunculus var. scolymus]|uniref:THH1/TOM1/TOM3 domain-containing protein n=1 Tax=Cynara cardunculus var. scolymus TaxID=59895 RepID=A0A103XVD4_CYNCS|nr:protein of unknown function DUF1084 [Cynara cardunculus var. scolymus]